MANEIAKLFVTIGLDDSDLQKSLKTLQGRMTSAGKEMALIGGAITAAMGLAVKAALEENIATSRLAQTLQNTGVAFADVKDQIDSVIQSQLRKTNYSDEQQLDALNSLVFTTGDYHKALAILPIALDLASAKQIDLASAALLLGKVNEGTVTQLKRMGIELSDEALMAAKAGDSTLALSEIYGKVQGAAEATVNPFVVLKNVFEETAVKVGNVLLPVLKQIVDAIVPVISNIGTWIEEHPTLSKNIIIVVAAIGGLMAVLGPLLITLPLLAAGFDLLLGPVGLVILAVTAVAAIAALVILNWDKVKAAFAKVWDWIKDHWVLVADIIGGPFLAAIAFVVTHWNDIVDAAKNAWENVKLAWGNVETWFGNLWTNIHRGWDNLWNGVGETWSTIWRGTANAIITGINWLTGLLNKIQVHIPSIDVLGWHTPEINFGVNIPEIPALATGGQFLTGGMALVGENGPEIAHFPAGATVAPLGKAGGGGGNTVIVNVAGSVRTDRELLAFIHEGLLVSNRGNVSLGFT